MDRITRTVGFRGLKRLFQPTKGKGIIINKQKETNFSFSLNCNDLKSYFTCGSKPCYEISKQGKQVCRRIFDKDGRSFFDHFSAIVSIPSVLPLILVGLVLMVVTSTVASSVVRNFIGTKNVRRKKKICH